MSLRDPVELFTSVKNRDKFNLSKQLQRALSVAQADEGGFLHVYQCFFECGSEARKDRYLEDDADTSIFWWCAVLKVSCVLLL